MNYLRIVLAAIYAALIILLLLTRCDRTHDEIMERVVHDTVYVDRPVEPVDTVAEEPADTVAEEPASEPERPARDEEAIEQAGNIGHDGQLKITLLWDFPGDVDLHVTEPNGVHLHYRNKRDPATGGFLDVDNTLGGRGSAENMYWENPQRGRYQVNVVYFSPGESEHTTGGPIRVVIKRTVNGREQTEVKRLQLRSPNRNITIPVASFSL